MAERVAVYGLTDDEQQALRELAQARYGTPSISLLAKKLLQAQLQQPEILPLAHLPKENSRKRITIRLPEMYCAFLAAIAEQKNCSINELLFDMVKNHVNEYHSEQTELLPLTHLPKPKSRKRITIRLPELDRAFLEETAAQQNCTINDLVRDIVQSHVRQHPFHSPEELNVLYQSNFQLVALGRNINQIARQLNAGEPISLSTQFLVDIKQMIDKHTEKVGQVLLTNRKRLPRKGE